MHLYLNVSYNNVDSFFHTYYEDLQKTQTSCYLHIKPWIATLSPYTACVTEFAWVIYACSYDVSNNVKIKLVSNLQSLINLQVVVWINQFHFLHNNDGSSELPFVTGFPINDANGSS